MPKEFANLLKNLDLSNIQIKIYLSVLKNGMSSVLDISKDIKINRSQIYLDASILLEKGFLELATKKTRKFLAVSPLRIRNIIESKSKKLEELNNILKDVNDFFDKNKIKDENDFEIKIYEGVNQVKKAFDFELHDSIQKEITSFVGDISFQYNFISSEYWDNWNKKFLENGGKGRMIIDKKDKHYERLQNLYKNVSYLKVKGLENFKLKSNVDVWGDKVLIVTFSKNPKAILITNRILAESYRDIFERLWNIAE
jgi:sugar-specific transcriptional regulator TrmB